MLWTIGTLVALWSPPPPTPGVDWPWLDKAVHLSLFAGAAVLWRASGAGLVAVAVGVVLGAALTELGQAMLPWPREPDLADVAFDVLGAALGEFGRRAITAGRARRSAENGDAPGAPEASLRNGRDSNPR